jgi:acetyl esterase
MSHPRNPQSLLSAESRHLLHAIAKAGRPPIQMLTPEQAKAFYAAGSQVLELDAHKMARDDTLHIPTRDGTQIRAKLWAEHAQPNLPVLLYFHGGGFTVGSPETHASLCRHLAHLAGCAVVSPDYRLGPEYKFPTAHNDAEDALIWLHDHASQLGLDGSRMAVGGDSAGATLSAATAVYARDHGISLAIQIMFYLGCSAQPMASMHQFEKGFVLEKATIDYFYGNYLRSEQDRLDPRFSALENPDVSGLASTWLGLAECDPIVDEGVAYADYLRMAGVSVDLEIYRGVIHGFIQMGRAIPQALTARMDAARALKHAFASKGTA